MSPTAKKPPFIRKLLHRCETEGNIFFIDPQNTTLGIFDPTVAKQINSDNYNDLTIPEKLSDQIKGQVGCPFSWATIRDAWQKAMQHPLQANELTKLTEHMSQLIDKQLNKEINLVSLSQEVIAQSLLPIIITNLSNKQIKSLLQDQQNKIKHFTIENPQPETFWQSLLSAFIQIRAANSVRQELRDRNKQKKPRQNDLLDPIVDMLPHLGIDRAVDAGTMILTAISGPPGAAASCLLYELCVKENWKHKLQEELTHIELSTLLKSPTKAAPITYRFVKEVLRNGARPLSQIGKLGLISILTLVMKNRPSKKGNNMSLVRILSIIIQSIGQSRIVSTPIAGYLGLKMVLLNEAVTFLLVGHQNPVLDKHSALTS